MDAICRFVTCSLTNGALWAISLMLHPSKAWRIIYVEYSAPPVYVYIISYMTILYGSCGLSFSTDFKCFASSQWAPPGLLQHLDFVAVIAM